MPGGSPPQRSRLLPEFARIDAFGLPSGNIDEFRRHPHVGECSPHRSQPYLPYIRPGASEAACLRMGRLCGMIVIVGAAVVSLKMMNVFQQLQLTWIVPVIFAAPFWGSLLATSYHNRILGDDRFYSRLLFCGPRLIPVVLPSLQESSSYTIVTDQVTTRVQRRQPQAMFVDA